MEKAKMFAFNFIASLFGYFAIFLVAYLLFWIFSIVGFPFLGVALVPSLVDIIIFGGHLLASIMLFFFLGTKLKLLGAHWISHLFNYLSVCGTVLVALFVAQLAPPYTIIFVALPFMGFALFTQNINITHLVIVYIFMPSIIIWLGMLYQSRQKNCQKMHHNQ